MKKCKYEGCGRKTWRKSEYCIFHEPSKNKDADLFWKGIDGMMKREDYNFRGFCFIPRRGKEFIDFRDVEFKHDVSFSNAAFFEDTFFDTATFSGDSSFYTTKFFRGASFDSARFSGGAGFGSASFTESASFYEVIFSREASFNHTTFSQGASFEKTTFSGHTSFNSATFFGGALFRKATFSGETFFDSTKFFGDAWFEEATFSKRVWFRTTKFSERAEFGGVGFSEEAWFKETTFSGHTSFNWATFFRGAWFNKTTFSKHASFNWASFSEEASFYEATFSKVQFKHTLFKMPEQIRFYHTDISKATFSPTTGLERIDFLSPIWAGSNSRKEIYIEKDFRLYNDNIANAYSEFENMYRQLKINYEKKRNYPDAGDFYIGEMEMRRKNPKTSIPEKFMISLYKLISNYGESYWRALGSLFGFVTILSIILTFTGIEINGRDIDYYQKVPLNPNYGKDFLEVVNIILKSITFQSLNSVETPSMLSKFIFTFGIVIGIVLIALLTLALRRRFRR